MSGPMRVVIVGNGIAAAMAAAHLARSFPPHAASIAVVPVPDEAPDPFGDMAASLPGFVRWNARFGIDEGELVRAGCLSFSLGTAHSGWAASGGTSFQPFGNTGATLEGVAFHQIAERLRRAGLPVRLSDYSVAALAAQAGRFAYPSPDPRTPLLLLDYGVHIDQPAYARLLLAQVTNLGVAQCSAPLRDVDIGPDGEVAALVLQDGSRVAGDFFIDASGHAATLFSRLTEATWRSWSPWLPCNRSLTLYRPADAPPAPYAHVVAEAAGWRRIVPGPSGVAETIATTNEQAPTRAGPVTEHRFEQGRRGAAWIGNCVALGQAATVLEPTFPFGLELLHRSLDRLAELFPSEAATAAERGEYNRRFAEEADRARDAVIARYILGGRQGAWWERLKQQQPPAELADKIALFRSRGRVPLLDGDLLDEMDWALLFDAQGERARRYDALADAVPVERWQAQLTRMRQAMIAAIAPLPLHGEFLASLARSRAA